MGRGETEKERGGEKGLGGGLKERRKMKRA